MMILRVIFDVICLMCTIFGLGAVLLAAWTKLVLTVQPEENLSEFDKELLQIFD